MGAQKLFNSAHNVNSDELASRTSREIEDIKTAYWQAATPPAARFREQVERFFFLRDVCVKFGAALFTAPLIFLALRILVETKIEKKELLFSILVFVMGIFLCAQSYFRTTQIAAFIVSYMTAKRPSRKPVRKKTSAKSS